MSTGYMATCSAMPADAPANMCLKNGSPSYVVAFPRVRDWATAAAAAAVATVVLLLIALPALVLALAHAHAPALVP